MSRNPSQEWCVLLAQRFGEARFGFGNQGAGMKVRMAGIAWVPAAILAFCAPMFAHHGNSAYEMGKTVSYKATITKFEYSNPHTQIYFDVADDKGNVEHWVAETTNPAMLNRVGWSRESLKPGDQVTLVVNPNKVGAKVVFLQKVVFSDGKELSTAKAF
jgi:Family of unknown function (DUF6152)